MKIRSYELIRISRPGTANTWSPIDWRHLYLETLAEGGGSRLVDQQGSYPDMEPISIDEKTGKTGKLLPDLQKRCRLSSNHGWVVVGSVWGTYKNGKLTSIPIEGMTDTHIIRAVQHCWKSDMAYPGKDSRNGWSHKVWALIVELCKRKFDVSALDTNHPRIRKRKDLSTGVPQFTKNRVSSIDLNGIVEPPPRSYAIDFGKWKYDSEEIDINPRFIHLEFDDE